MTGGGASAGCFVESAPMKPRAAEAADLDLLTIIWYSGWQDAHAQILPPELARHRTVESFRERLLTALADVRVAGPQGQPLGFCLTKADELYQLYVSKEARGSGLAGVLLADAEARLSSRGISTAWLACAIGNTRAEKFYEKQGWQRVGSMTNLLPTPDGIFPLEVWRYEKALNEA